MANEKRLIDANALIKHMKDLPTRYEDGGGSWLCLDGYPKGMFDPEDVISSIDNAPTVDAVEVDTVIEMFEYMLGDCPCNFSPVDEWLAERCELQEECPWPEDEHGCWKQFIKHFCAKMDGDGNG